MTSNLTVSDAALAEFNAMFEWRAAAALPDGRLLGALTEEKRPHVNAIPDRRIQMLDKFIGLRDRDVLEIGCFEGIHSVGLCSFGARLTAIDVRPANVAKTLLRLSLHGQSARVAVADCESLPPDTRFDTVFHFGVLYHLMNPVEHIHQLAGLCEYLYLDTHYALEATVNTRMRYEGVTYAALEVDEGGWHDPFSGKDATAVHLSYRSLMTALSAAGFANQRTVQFRDERNGPRVLILAAKSADLTHVPNVTELAL